MLDTVMSGKLQELRRQQRIIVRRMEALAKGQFNDQSRAEFEVLDSTAQQLRAKIREIEPDSEAEKRRGRERAFRNYLRFGLNPDPARGTFGVSSEDRALLVPAYQARTIEEGPLGGSYPGVIGGGVLAPIGFAGRIMEALKFHSDMFACSTIIPTATGTPLPYPEVDDTAVSGELITESTQFTTADLSNPGQQVFGSYKVSSRLIKASTEFVQDVFAGFEDWFVKQVATRIARGASPYLTNGTGVNQPTGIITAATASGQTVRGDENSSPSSPQTQLGWSDFLSLESSLDAAYRRRGSWMMHADTLQFIKNLCDKQGRPLHLWTPAPNDDDTDSGRIFGHRVYLNNSMSPIGPGARSLLFGDLSRYTIRSMALNVTRLTERYVDFGQIGWIGIQRLDGALLKAGTPVKYLQQPS